MKKQELIWELESLRKRISDLDSCEVEHKELQHLVESLFKYSPIGLYISQDGCFKAISAQFTTITGYTDDELIGTSSLEIVLPEDRDMVRTNAIAVLRGERSEGYEFRIVTKPGEKRTIRETIASIQYLGRRAVVSNFMDVTEHKELEEKQGQLIQKLQESLAEVKTLSGLLPVCAWCKNLRDEEGYWESVEEYISQHTGAGFTHGMCPSCQEKVYTERFAGEDTRQK